MRQSLRCHKDELAGSAPSTMYKQKAVEGGGDKSTRRCLTTREAVKYNVANAQ